MRRKSKSGSRLNTRILVNRQHSVNRLRYGWWMTVPHLAGGRQIYDLLGRTHGTLNSFAVAAWGNRARPGGFGDLMFDTFSYVDCGSADTRFNFTTENFTIAFWFYSNSLGTSPVPINRGAYQTGGWYVFMSTAGAVILQCEATGVDNALSTGSGVAVTGAWQHFILTRTGTSTGAIYLNGKAVSTSGALGNCTSSALPLQIGKYSTNADFVNGFGDDWGIWGRGFTPADALELYNLSSTGYPGVLYRASSPLLGPTGTTTVNGTAAMIGDALLSATGTAIVLGTGAFVGVSSLAAAASAIVSGAAAMTGVGLLTPAGLVISQATAAMIGIGSETAVGSVITPAQASMIGVGALSSNGSVKVLGQAAMIGIGSLGANAGGITSAVAHLVGVSLMSAGQRRAHVPLIIVSVGGGSDDGFSVSGGVA